MDNPQAMLRVLTVLARLMEAEDVLDEEDFIAHRQVLVEDRDTAERTVEYLKNAQGLKVPGIEGTRTIELRETDDGYLIVMGIRLDGPLIDVLRILKDAGR